MKKLRTTVSVIIMILAGIAGFLQVRLLRTEWAAQYFFQ